MLNDMTVNIEKYCGLSKQFPIVGSKWKGNMNMVAAIHGLRHKFESGGGGLIKFSQSQSP